MLAIKPINFNVLPNIRAKMPMMRAFSPILPDKFVCQYREAIEKALKKSPFKINDLSLYPHKFLSELLKELEEAQQIGLKIPKKILIPSEKNWRKLAKDKADTSSALFFTSTTKSDCFIMIDPVFFQNNLIDKPQDIFNTIRHELVHHTHYKKIGTGLWDEYQNWDMLNKKQQKGLFRLIDTEIFAHPAIKQYYGSNIRYLDACRVHAQMDPLEFVATVLEMSRYVDISPKMQKWLDFFNAPKIKNGPKPK